MDFSLGIDRMLRIRFVYFLEVQIGLFFVSGFLLSSFWKTRAFGSRSGWWSLVLFLHISHLSFHTFSRIKSMWKKGKYEKVPSINPFFTNLQTKDHKLRSSFLFFWVICNLLSSVGLERIYLLALPPCLLKISLWDDMEVPEESFHWSSWDSWTCYPRRAFIQGLTDDWW